MAIIYVRSTDGSDADNGSTWALAKATLAGAFTAASAGDTIYVSDNHSELNNALVTLTPPGTAASPNYVICVDDSAEPPTTLATSAIVQTSTTANRNIDFKGYAYYYGIKFITGQAGINSQSITFTQTSPGSGLVFNNCVFDLNNTGSSSLIMLGGTSAPPTLSLMILNSSFVFGATSHKFSLNKSYTVIQNSTFALTGTVPTTLISLGSIHYTNLYIAGCDLSALTSGNNLINVGTTSLGLMSFRNCKLGSGVSITTSSFNSPNNVRIELVNCDSADTNYRYHYSDYSGIIEHETIIVRTGGASDGTTSISREMISSANANKTFPLILSDLVYWNESVGANTLTVHIITDNVTLTDQECWLEVEYLGTSGVPWALFTDDADSIADRLLGGSASNQTTSTETWTTTGLTTPVKQQLSVSITPQEKGPIRCRVVLAKPNTTVYVCPKIEVS